MRSCLILGLILVALVMAQCLPITNQWNKDIPESKINNKFLIMGNNQLIEKHHKLIEAAKALFDKLQADGRTDQANRLWQAIECANRFFQAFNSINPGKEFNFSVKAIIENLKKYQNQLDHLIHELKNNNHYDDSE